MNRDNPSDDEATAGRSRRKIKNLMEFTFEADWGFADARRANEARRLRRDLCQFEFVDRRVILTAGNVHGLTKIVSHDADDEFFRFADVAKRVFGFAVGTRLDGFRLP